MLSKINNADITLNIQYIKEFSFKNMINFFENKDNKPRMDVIVDLNATKINQEIFELDIIIDINSFDTNNKQMFSIHLVYCGIFTIKNADDNLIKENLFIDCPTMLFPFARSIISNTSIQSNLPPIILDIIDFENMYNSRKETI